MVLAALVTVGRAGPAVADLEAIHLVLSPVGKFQIPVAMAVRPGDANLYVAEKGGKVRTLSGRTVLDLTGQVGTQLEQGLLGLAFSGDGNFLYLHYTDLAGNIHITQFAFTQLGLALRGTGRDLLVIPHTHSPSHNGGNIQFGSDGMLWIGTGDGGGHGDPDNNAQNPSSLLGKLLRIDPRPIDPKRKDATPYTVPGDNPFAHTPGFRPEIWALGLRNPWRFSFDSANGDLWIGDVGEHLWEEIDFHPATAPGGPNYGWPRFEGSHPFSDRPAPGAVPPLFDYGHDTNHCAVVGGYVYRGQRIPALRGAYVFSDVCNREILGLTQVLGAPVAVRGLGVGVPNQVSFGQDHAGELYVLSYDGGIWRIDPG